MQSLETKSWRPRPKSFETETETSKNGSRDASRDRDQVSRLHHWCNQPNDVWSRNKYKTYLSRKQIKNNILYSCKKIHKDLSAWLQLLETGGAL